MSYGNIQKTLLSLNRRGFTPVWYPAEYHDELIFEGYTLRAALNELSWVGGHFGRKWMNRAVTRQLSGGANL